MKTITVCPLSKLNETLISSGAERMISLMSCDTQMERPTEIAQENHLVLLFNDIVVPRVGLVPPAEQHIKALINFAQDWDWSTPLLIHCWAGISRSPAAAAIIAMAMNPSREDDELAKTMRRLSRSITPNIKMIEIADQHLGRSGFFGEAFRSIGRGEDAFEGAPFALQL